MSGRRCSILILLLSGLALFSAGGSPALGQAPPASPPSGASASYRLDWVATGEVSGGQSASAGYRLSATISQMGAGTRGKSAHYALCVGFQCAAAESAYPLYLPLVLR
jgi:hypothetical protein